jgi:hypothetical protein
LELLQLLQAAERILAVSKLEQYSVAVGLETVQIFAVCGKHPADTH